MFATDELWWHLHQTYFDRIEGPDESPFWFTVVSVAWLSSCVVCYPKAS